MAKRRTPAEVSRLEGELLHLVGKAGLSTAAACRHIGVPPDWYRRRRKMSPAFAALLVEARATATTESSTQDWRDPSHALPIEFPPLDPDSESAQYDWLTAKPYGTRRLTDGGMRILRDPIPCGALNGAGSQDAA